MTDKEKLHLFIKELNNVNVPEVTDELIKETIEIINNVIAEYTIMVNEEYPK